MITNKEREILIFHYRKEIEDLWSNDEAAAPVSELKVKLQQTSQYIKRIEELENA